MIKEVEGVKFLCETKTVYDTGISPGDLCVGQMVTICECGSETDSPTCRVSLHSSPEKNITRTITLEVTESELTKIILALNMRSRLLHNFADEHLGSNTALEYREAGNAYSALAIKANRLL